MYARVVDIASINLWSTFSSTKKRKQTDAAEEDGNERYTENCLHSDGIE